MDDLYEANKVNMLVERELDLHDQHKEIFEVGEEDVERNHN